MGAGEGTIVIGAGSRGRGLYSTSRGVRIALWIVFALFSFPFVPLVVASFAFRWHWPAVLPTEWLWTARDASTVPVGWAYLFSRVSRLGPAFANTTLIGVAVASLAVALALPAARVIARYDFRGKSFFEFVFLMPVIVPQISIGIGTLLLFLRLGLVRTHVGVILAHLVPTLPYALRIMTAVFQNLDHGYEEVAQTLGAGRMQRFVRVVLPLVLPGVATAGLFAFLISSNVFLLTFLVSGGRIPTLPTMLFSHIESGAPLDATTAGLVVIVSLPGIAFLLLTDRLTGQRLSLASLGSPVQPAVGGRR